MNFPGDLSLQNFAMISYASWFWKRPNIQAKLRTLVLKYGDACISEDYNNQSKMHEEECKNFLKQISEALKSMDLPWVILSDLINVINSLGLRIFYWYENIYKRFKICPSDCIRNLNWTCYGTFDESDIIGTEWSNSEKDLAKSSEILRDFKYYMASSYILKNYISQLSIRIVNSYRKNITATEMHRYILCSAFFFKGNDRLLKTQMKGQKCSKETYMFRLAVQTSCETGIWYYWKMIKGTVEKNELVNAAIRLFKDCISLYENDLYKIDHKCSDCLALLLMEMSETEKQSFFRKAYKDNYYRFGLIIKINWPEKKLFLPLFEIHNKTSKEKIHYNFLLDKISRLLKTYHDFGFDVKKIQQYKMFFTVINEIQIRFADNPFYIYPATDDKHILYPRLTDVLKGLFSIFDIEILDAIMNSACDKSMRRMALCAGIEKYKEFVEAGEYEKLNAFAEVILKTYDERKWFKEELLHFFPGFILEDRFDEADKLLDWGLSSEEDKKLFKNRFDILSICAKNFFKTNTTLLADKTLKWFFPNDEDKKEYVNNFPFNEFWGSKPKEPLPFLFVNRFKNGADQYPRMIRPHYLTHPEFELLSIILAEGEDFISNARKFLNWFFNSKEEVDQFKREILNESILKNFVKNTFLFYHHHEVRNDLVLLTQSAVKTGCGCPQPYYPVRLELVNEFLKFCTSLENSESLKRKILNDIEDWLLYFSKNYVGVDQMDDFLEWILKEVKLGQIKRLRKKSLRYEKVVQDGKRIIIKTFLCSSNAAEFFENLVRHHSLFARYENRLAAWIKMLGDETDIENLIDLSGIESSLMNNYHWEFCRIKGTFPYWNLPRMEGWYSSIICGCALNIRDLKFMIETLKTKRNFEECYKLKEYGHRIRWMDGSSPFHITGLYFSDDIEIKK